MANKYLIIPEELYRGLTEAEPDNINLDYEKKELRKTKKYPKKDRTAKNIIYNQELNRYLKIRKEHANKPIKVELSNGLKILTKKTPKLAPAQPKRTPSLPKRTPSHSSRTSTKASRSPVQSEQSDDFDETFRLGGDDDDDDDEAFIQQPSHSNFTPPTFPPATPPTHHRSVTITENDMRDELYNIIFTNPGKFNVTAIGKIKNYNGRPMPDSNVLQSISRILSPKADESTPKGTSILRTDILRDPDAKKIYDQAMSIQMAKKYGHSYNPTGKKQYMPQQW
jgi:hypothetical protein